MRILRWLSRLWTLVLLAVVVICGLLIGLRLLLPLPLFSARPVLLQTTPRSGEANVALRSQITLHFNVPMNPRSVEQALLIEPQTPYAGQWSDDLTTLIISPTAALRPGATYTITVREHALNRFFRPLESPAQFTFATAPAPAVVSVLPADGAHDVALDTPISVSFSRPIVPPPVAARPAVLPELRFDPPISGTATWLDQSTVLFRPAGPLQPGTRYRATLAAGLTDLTGGPLGEPFSWGFSTSAPRVLSITPRDGDQGVAPRAPLVFHLSQPFDPAVIQASLIISPSITGTLAAATQPDATQLITFTPSAEWQPGMTYVVELRPRPLPLNGNVPLAQQARWQFQAAPRPQVVGRFPGEGQTLPPGQDIRLIFNTPVDADALRAAITFTPPVDAVRVMVGENETRLSADLKAASVYTLTLSQALADRNGTSSGREYQFRFVTAPAAPALVFPDVTHHIARLVPGATDLAIRRTNLSALNISLYSLDEATLVRTTGFSETDWLAFRPERYNQSLLRSWSVPVVDPLNTVVEGRLSITDAGNQPLPPGAYYVQIRTPEGPRADLLLLVSRAELVLQQSGTNLLVWAINTVSGAPVGGLQVALYREGALIQRGTTNQDGLWQVTHSAPAARQPPVVVASGDGFSMASSAWSPAGGNGGTRYRAFVTTDRSAYLPGQALSVGGFVRAVDDQSTRLPGSALQGRLSARRVDAFERIYDAPIQIQSTGVISAGFTIPPGAPPGAYVLTLTLDGVSSSVRFSIQDPEPAPFAVSIGAPEPRADGAQAITITTAADGTLLSGVGITWTLSTGRVSFPAIEGYVFGNDEAATRAEVRTGTGRTGPDGRLTVVITDVALASQGPLLYRLDVQATMAGSVTATASKSLAPGPDQQYPGVRLPGSLFVAQKQTPVELVAVTADGQPVRGADVRVEVYRRTWVQAGQSGAGDQRQAGTQPQEDRVLARAATTDDAGRASVALALPRGGEYRLRASIAGAAQHGAITETSLWVAEPGFTDWRQESGDRIMLIPDRAAYRPGDTATLLLATPFDTATALVTVRRGDALTGTVQTVRAGDLLSVAIGSTDPPLVQVAVLLMDNRAGGGTTAPARELRFAAAALPVMTPERVLAVNLATDHGSYAPGSTALLTVTTTDAQGRGMPADVVISMVDFGSAAEGDIAAAFQPAVIPALWTARARDISAQPPARGPALSGQSAPAAPAPVPPAAPVYWKVGRTASDGVLTATVQLPRAVGTLRTLAWAAAGPDRFGQAQRSLLVTSPLQLDLQAPPFLRAGDTFELQARLQNTGTVSQTVRLTLNADGVDVQTRAPLAQQVLLAPGAAQQVVWPAIAPLEGHARLEVTARPDHGTASMARVERQILPAGHTLHVERSVLVEGRYEQQIALPKEPPLVVDKMVVQIAPTERALAQHIAQALAARPERSSIDNAALVLISTAFSDTAPLGSSALAQLIAAQHDDGGWGWWAGSPSNPDVTAFALEALAAARQARLDVPQQAIDRGLNALRESVDSLAPPLIRAHAQYVLSLYGKADGAVLKALAGDPPALGAEGLAYVLLSGSASTPHDRLLSALAGLAGHDGAGAYWPADEQDSLAGETGATALAVLALEDEPGTADLLAAARRWLAAARRGDGWANSYASARALAALRALPPVGAAGSEPGVALNGTPLIAGANGRAELANTRQITLTRDQLRPNNDLIVTGTLFLNYQLLATTPTPVAQGSGVKLLREYLDPQTGRLVDPAQLRVGQMVRVRLTIVATRALQFVTIDDPLAGSAALVGRGSGTFEHAAQAEGRVTLAHTALEPGIYEYTYLLRLTSPGSYTLPSPIARLLNGDIVGGGQPATITIMAAK